MVAPVFPYSKPFQLLLAEIKRTKTSHIVSFDTLFSVYFPHLKLDCGPELPPSDQTRSRLYQHSGVSLWYPYTLAPGCRKEVIWLVLFTTSLLFSHAVSLDSLNLIESPCAEWEQGFDLLLADRQVSESSLRGTGVLRTQNTAQERRNMRLLRLLYFRLYVLVVAEDEYCR